MGRGAVSEERIASIFRVEKSASEEPSGCRLQDCEFHFHHHYADFLVSHALKLLGLFRTTTFSFSTSDSLLILYFALVISKLEYASVAWNSVTVTDSNNLKSIQRKF
jgi:hypothetical protein